MKKLIRAALLVLVLFVCAQAEGIIQTGVIPPPPPPSLTSTQSSDEPTEATDETTQTDVVETARDVSLGLLQSLLAIF
jgi:hypothetical protein